MVSLRQCLTLRVTDHRVTALEHGQRTDAIERAHNGGQLLLMSFDRLPRRTLKSGREALSLALDRLAELNGELSARDRAPTAPDGHIRRRLRRYRSTLVLALALACPERRGALAALEADDCDLEAGEVRYRASTTKTGEANTQGL